MDDAHGLPDATQWRLTTHPTKLFVVQLFALVLRRLRHLLLSDIPAIAYAFSLPNGDDFRRMSRKRARNTVDRHYAYLPLFRAPSASPADGAFL